MCRRETLYIDTRSTALFESLKYKIVRITKNRTPTLSYRSYFTASALTEFLHYLYACMFWIQNIQQGMGKSCHNIWTKLLTGSEGIRRNQKVKWNLRSELVMGLSCSDQSPPGLENISTIFDLFYLCLKKSQRSRVKKYPGQSRITSYLLQVKSMLGLGQGLSLLLAPK